jgi:hypothetical protein
MSRVRVVINGYVEMDEKLGEWRDTPPDFIRDHMKPGTRHQPHMKMILVAVTEAIMSDASVEITADTSPTSYTLTVSAL